METNENSEAYIKSQGDFCYNNKDHIKAIEWYSTGIHHFPILSTFYLRRSSVYLSQHQYQNSLNDSLTAKSLDPTNPKAFHLIALAYQSLDLYPQAIDILLEFFSLGISNTEIFDLHKEIFAKNTENFIESQHPENKKFEDLINWLVDGGAIFPKIRLEYYSEGYRGVHSSCFIRNGESIIFIPFSLIITTDVAKSSPVYRKLEEWNLDSYTFRDLVLATFLLYEKINPNSIWKRYLDVLPNTFPGFPVFFKDTEKNYLTGSAFLKRLNVKISEIKSDYEKICQANQSFTQFSLEDFTKARMAVSSRTYSIKVNDTTIDAFVPLADMLNHSNTGKATWTYSNPRGGFLISATEDIAKNEVVMESYGIKCNARFFLNYGFLLDENEENDYPFLAKLTPDTPHSTLKVMRMKKKYFIYLLKPVIDENFLDFLSCLRFIEETDVEKVYSFVTGEENVDECIRAADYAPVSIEREKKLLEMVVRMVREYLSGFMSSLEEDLKRVGRVEGNERNCLKMVICEKKVLKFFQGALGEMMRCLDDPKGCIADKNLSADCSFYLKHIVIPLYNEDL